MREYRDKLRAGSKGAQAALAPYSCPEWVRFFKDNIGYICDGKLQKKNIFVLEGFVSMALKDYGDFYDDLGGEVRAALEELKASCFSAPEFNQALDDDERMYLQMTEE